MHPRMRRRDVGEELSRISETVLDAALEVHRTLGRGLLERAYQQALAVELEDRELRVEREVPVEVTYKSVPLGMSLRVDLLVARAVVVEVKAVSEVHEAHEAQLRSYLHWTGCRVGMLFNFHAPLLMQGFRRFVR